MSLEKVGSTYVYNPKGIIQHHLVYVFFDGSKYHAGTKDRNKQEGYQWIDIRVLADVKRGAIGNWLVKKDTVPEKHWKRIFLQIGAEAI